MLARAYKGIVIPTVRSIEGAELLAADFPSVITAGPSPTEVNWGHPNHCIEKFNDTEDDSNIAAPTQSQISKLIEFGSSNNDPILIHCHAGISRSTATAIGVSVSRGLSPEDAFEALIAVHPTDNRFCPNSLILSHVELCLDLKSGSLTSLVNYFDRIALVEWLSTPKHCRK